MVLLSSSRNRCRSSSSCFFNVLLTVLEGFFVDYFFITVNTSSSTFLGCDLMTNGTSSGPRGETSDFSVVLLCRIFDLLLTSSSSSSSDRSKLLIFFSCSPPPPPPSSPSSILQWRGLRGRANELLRVVLTYNGLLLLQRLLLRGGASSGVVKRWLLGN